MAGYKQAFAALGVIHLALAVISERDYPIGGEAVPVKIAAGQLAILFFKAFFPCKFD
jgi:hypothetical protein